MKISGIDSLDIGMSNISIEGKITYTLAPRHVEGDNKKGHYDFWSQFVVIEDETGKIGCSVSIEKEEYKLEEGMIARIKGKLEEYKDKKGIMQKSIRGSLVGISKGGKITDVQLEVAKEFFDDKAKETIAIQKAMQTEVKSEKEKIPISVWEEKDLRIARECAIKAVTELICNKIMKNKDFFTFADTIVKYIYDGIKEKTKSIKKATKAGKLKIARDTVESSEPLKVKDEDVSPVSDELTEEDIEEIKKTVEEPGSSYDNAIEFKSKKKRNSKGETADEDIPF